MFDVILNSNKVLNQVDVLSKQVKACSGDELLYLRDVLRDVLQGKNQEQLSDELTLVAHMYTVFNKIGGKKYAELQKVTNDLGKKVGKDLDEFTDERIIKCLDVGTAPYWKYDSANGLHHKEYNKVTYYATDLYHHYNVTKFYRERAKQ